MTVIGQCSKCVRKNGNTNEFITRSKISIRSHKSLLSYTVLDFCFNNSFVNFSSVKSVQLNRVYFVLDTKKVAYFIVVVSNS